MKYINAVGIEIEGTWNEIPDCDDKPPFVYEFKYDGSLTEPEGWEDYPISECVSVPLKSVRQVRKFFDGLSPTYEVPAKHAGLHMHISLKRKEDYMLLFSRKFYETYIKWYKATWGTDVYNQRINGDYCRAINPDYFKSGYEISRYVFVNYIPAYNRHKTYEFRGLFAASLPVMRKQIEEHIKFIEAYLEDAHKTKPIPIKKSIKIYANVEYMGTMLYYRDRYGQMKEYKRIKTLKWV